MGIYDRIQDLFVERLRASNFIAYAAMWDTLKTYVDVGLQNLKTFTFEFVASSSQKQEHLEAKLTNVVAAQEVMGAHLQNIVANKDSIMNKQEDMDARLKFVVVRQNDMGFDIKTILWILKNVP